MNEEIQSAVAALRAAHDVELAARAHAEDCRIASQNASKDWFEAGELRDQAAHRLMVLICEAN